jgi:hypothetical protein
MRGPSRTWIDRGGGPIGPLDRERIDAYGAFSKPSGQV